MISTVTTYQYTCVECMYMYMYMYVCANENRTRRKVNGHIVLREAVDSYLGLNEPDLHMPSRSIVRLCWEKANESCSQLK